MILLYTILAVFGTLFILGGLLLVSVLNNLNDKLNVVLGALHDVTDIIKGWELRLKNGTHVNGQRKDVNE